jgi:ATP-dependent DNA helicase Q4
VLFHSQQLFQVTGLPNGIRGVCLHTNMTAQQRENVLESVKLGKAQFLLVSPEAIAGGSMSLIASMASLPPVAFVCIDEAHCLSEWSHNFRPSYLRLCKVSISHYFSCDILHTV